MKIDATCWAGSIYGPGIWRGVRTDFQGPSNSKGLATLRHAPDPSHFVVVLWFSMKIGHTPPPHLNRPGSIFFTHQVGGLTGLFGKWVEISGRSNCPKSSGAPICPKTLGRPNCPKLRNRPNCPKSTGRPNCSTFPHGPNCSKFPHGPNCPKSPGRPIHV